MIEDVLSGRGTWHVEHGENLAVMRAMPAASVHLVYGDAPFNTGRDFASDDGRPAYSDKWPSLDAFVDHVRDRCAAARDLLTDDGTLVVQVDPETSHYVKVALDGVFGRACFRNEIVWRYRKWGSPTPNFQRCHDVLLRYTRHPERTRWTQLHEPLAASTIAIHGTRKQAATWSTGAQKHRWNGYADSDSPGAYMSDVWEIGIIAPNGRERLGYPTQKPRALADRIVLACSLPGDLALDPWCGSGTTVSAAVAHGRRAIGIDQSPVAVEIATARLTRETSQRDWLAESGAA